MRNEANERGTVESGFRRAEDGWHMVKFNEGIDLLTNKEGELALSKGGEQNWKIPMVVDDVDDASHEVEIDLIVTENDKGEKMLTNILGATDLYVAFAKNFPGDVSVFDEKCINKIKQKLPEKYWLIKTKQNPYKDKVGKDQIAVNIIGFGKSSDKVDKLEAELFPSGGAKAGKAKKAAPLVEDEDF